MSAPAPTTSRIHTMDVLRGVAILGILLANVTAFSTPSMAIFDQTLLKLGPGENIVLAVRELFVSGKMRSLLAMLFGAGLYLQYASAMARYKAEMESRGEGDMPDRPAPNRHWPGPYLKRTAWLGAIGIIHGLFFWFGDILFLYSVTAFLVALLVAKLSDKVILWVAAITVGLYGIGSLGLQALFTVISPGSGSSGIGIPALDRFLTASGETSIYQSANYLDQFLHRAFTMLNIVFGAPFMVPLAAAIFLVGALLARRGVIANPGGHKGDVKWLLIVGLGIGLPINLLAAALQAAGSKVALTLVVETMGAPLLALGYLGIILLAAPKLPRLVLKPFESVGRVALSCYLMQTLLATTAFYGWGFDLYGKLDWRGQLAVVGVIWVCNIAFALVWTRLYSIGPVEWVWRSLAAGKKLPWRSAEPARTVPPPVIGSGVKGEEA